MKSILKISLLLASIPLALSACEKFEKHTYCLETSNDTTYHPGMCYQASTSDVLESVFIINPPINPEADEKDYQYDLMWNYSIKLSYFTFTGGLVGKKIISVLKLGSDVIKVNIDNTCENQKATSGYIKISHYAYTALSERAKDAYAFAYVALGPASDLVVKPSNTNENDSQSSSASIE